MNVESYSDKSSQENEEHVIGNCWWKGDTYYVVKKT